MSILTPNVLSAIVPITPTTPSTPRRILQASRILTPRIKTSKYWAYFDELAKGGEFAAQCRVCEKSDTRSFIKLFGNTSNLKRHLEQYHPDEARAVKSAEADDKQKLAVPIQQKLAFSFFSGASKSKEKVTGLIANQVIMDLRPISIVEDMGTKLLLADAYPGIEPPCRATLTKYLMKLFDEAKHHIQAELAAADHVSLTTDGWTRKGSAEAYTTVTCHFINSTREYKSYVLHTLPCNFAHHTGVNLENELSQVLRDWQIDAPDKVAAVATDTAANEVKAIRLSGLPHIRCSAHLIQLAIKDAFKVCPSIGEMFKACTNIVSDFHGSNVNQYHLSEAQKALHETELKLLQNVSLLMSLCVVCRAALSVNKKT